MWGARRQNFNEISPETSDRRQQEWNRNQEEIGMEPRQLGYALILFQPTQIYISTSWVD